jgi:hypothetical protein
MQRFLFFFFFEHLAPGRALGNAKVSVFLSSSELLNARAMPKHTHTTTHTQVGIKILSNLADRRLVHAYTSIPVERLATPTIDGMQE